MSLTKQDLASIKHLIDDSIDERVPRIIDERVPAIIDERLNDQVPKIVQPMLDHLEKRMTVKIDQLTLDVGQFSLETTDNFIAVNAHLEDLDDGLAKVFEMTDNNRVELRKLKQRLGTT